MHTIRFFVPGLAKPAGSKRAFAARRGGRPTGKIIVTDDAGKAGKSWRQDVKLFAAQAYRGAPLDSPLSVHFKFVVARPLNHFGSGKNAQILKATAPAHPTTKPDTTKLIRAVEDALTGVLWRDDALIVNQFGAKVYCCERFPTPGVWVLIDVLRRELPEKTEA